MIPTEKQKREAIEAASNADLGQYDSKKLVFSAAWAVVGILVTTAAEWWLRRRVMAGQVGARSERGDPGGDSDASRGKSLGGMAREIRAQAAALRRSPSDVNGQSSRCYDLPLQSHRARGRHAAKHFHISTFHQTQVKLLSKMSQRTV